MIGNPQHRTGDGTPQPRTQRPQLDEPPERRSHIVVWSICASLAAAALMVALIEAHLLG